MSTRDWAGPYHALVLLPLVVAGVQLCCYRHAHVVASLVALVLADVAVMASVVSVGYVIAQAMIQDAGP
jgi:hypothetical protein